MISLSIHSHLFPLNLMIILLSFTSKLMEVDASLLKGHLQPLGQQRPPEGSVESLPFAPSGRDFYRKYIQPSKPVIIRNAIWHWPALKLWTSKSYVKENFAEEIFTVELRKKYKDEYPIKRIFKLRDFVDKYQNEQIYMDSEIRKESSLLTDIYLPPCLQCKELSSAVNKLNLLWSSGNTSSAFHQDGYENIIAMISGVKKVILYDIKYTRDLYGNDFKVSAGVSRIDPESVDLEKYPNFATVPYLEGVLNAGDLLYIPQYWWHHVRSFDDPNIAVNIWFDMFDFTDELEARNLDELQHVIEVSELFRELASKQPKEIDCKDKSVSLREYLKVNESDASSLHLRIPRANQRPEDVTLLSGYKMPVLGLGTAFLNESTTSSVKYALKVGYRLFDTAQGYPGSEEAIGKAIQESDVPRSEIFVVTKLHPRFLGYDSTLKAINDSLKKLQMDYIDLWLIHSQECDDYLLTCEKGEPIGTWQDSWKAMEHAQKLGQIRSLGVSNFGTSDLEELTKLAKLPVSVVQNWFDPLHQDRKVRKFCEEKGIKYMGYSTLGSYWTFMGMEENPVLTSDLLIEISGHYDYVVSHVVLRWAIHKNVIVIPRSSNPNHIEQNFRSLDIKLHRLEIEAIDELQDLLNKVLEEETAKIDNATVSEDQGTGKAEVGVDDNNQDVKAANEKSTEHDTDSEDRQESNADSTGNGKEKLEAGNEGDVELGLENRAGEEESNNRKQKLDTMDTGQQEPKTTFGNIKGGEL